MLSYKQFSILRRAAFSIFRFSGLASPRLASLVIIADGALIQFAQLLGPLRSYAFVIEGSLDSALAEMSLAASKLLSAARL